MNFLGINAPVNKLCGNDNTIFKNKRILKEHEEVESPSDNFVIKIIIIAILIFALCAIIFVIIGKLYGKQLFGGRKKKANYSQKQ